MAVPQPTASLNLHSFLGNSFSILDPPRERPAGGCLEKLCPEMPSERVPSQVQGAKVLGCPSQESRTPEQLAGLQAIPEGNSRRETDVLVSVRPAVPVGEPLRGRGAVLPRTDLISFPLVLVCYFRL